MNKRYLESLSNEELRTIVINNNDLRNMLEEKYIEDTIEKDFAEIGAPKLVPIKAYIDMEKEAADERNGWLHTRLLKVSGYPGMGSNNIHLGYADVETFKDETI